MSTAVQFSSKNPTIKRIMKEASELNNSPSPDYHAAPLENDIFEWHFTLRGPPAPSPFEGGIYHGRIVLPPAYPMKPPSFRFTTPSGRFEVNREICLSISGHHEETWQPAWGIRTALVAIRSFMDTDAKGQLGGMDAGEELRRRYAKQSAQHRCTACAKTNVEIMKEQDQAVQDLGADAVKQDDDLPAELRLAYREDLAGSSGADKANTPPERVQTNSSTPQSAPAIQTTIVQPQARDARRAEPQDVEALPPWIDKAIGGVIVAIMVLLWSRYLA